MKYLLAILLLIGCAASNNTTCPPPSISYDTVRTTLRDTVQQIVTITKVTRITDTVPAPINYDTAHGWYLPVNGDSWPMLQAAINSQQPIGGVSLNLGPGYFSISRPLVVASIINGVYQTSFIRINGCANAQNGIAGQVTHIVCNFDTGFAIGLQQCKSCEINNIEFDGRYAKPQSLTQLQIDTMPLSGWYDGIHSFNRGCPYAGIVIDPFSDPIYYDTSTRMYPNLLQYYLPGMSRSGSTAVNVRGCMMAGFVLGFGVSVSHQQNGELINFIGCNLTDNAFGYAACQAQSKVNLVSDFMSWGNTYCLFDMMHFGLPSNDGVICPMIDGGNIAGTTHELIEHRATSFPVTIKRVYAEGLFMLGELYAAMGANLEDLQIDFQQPSFANIPNVPSPGVVFAGQGVTFNSCAFRMYVGNAQWNRLSFFGYNLFFDKGAMGAPSVMGNVVNGQQCGGCYFDHVTPYYAGSIMTGTDTWDSPIALGNLKLHYNGDFTGYVIGADTTQLSANDMLVTQWHTASYFTTVVDNYCVGYVDHFSKDTTFLTVMGYGLTNDSTYNIYDDRYH